MKKILLLSLLAFLATVSKAQIISKFTWDFNPVTQAIIGPNAISVSSSATSSPGGVGGTNGLNGGPGSNNNIDLVLPGSVFNVAGIDIAVDYVSYDNNGSLFTRDKFNFGPSGQKLSIAFALVSGSGFTLVTANNLYNMPTDGLFHHYDFRYDNVAGVAKITVDGNVVYTYNGTPGAALYWTGAGDATVAANITGGGNNVAVMDNLVIQNIASSSLPLSLLSFNAANHTGMAQLSWATTREMNVDAFIVQRSDDGFSFTDIKRVSANNGYALTNNYTVTDSTPLKPVSFYRLRMVDIDGKFTYSGIRQVSFSNSGQTQVSCYPNPATSSVYLHLSNATTGMYRYTVTTVDGKTLMAQRINTNAGTQDIPIDLGSTTVRGLLVVQVTDMQTNYRQSFRIIRQ